MTKHTWLAQKQEGGVVEPWLDERGPGLVLLSSPGFVPGMDLGAVEAEHCWGGEQSSGRGALAQGGLPHNLSLPSRRFLPYRRFHVEMTLCFSCSSCAHIWLRVTSQSEAVVALVYKPCFAD